ncbi:MAG: Na/Pi cotransporter family protein [Termitinemataceae bacterium]|nr:MAG: Na/Pi cotransporter family protein [Termitinemataceae bacterium]
MKYVLMILQFAGSLSFLLYGMKMMSDGIQKSAGKSLHRVMGFMTKNRVMAVLTGTLITCVIQSSSATTVMIVSFVNSGILTLPQAIGTIFGANIGTTFTAWIVSLLGFKLKIAAFAIPVFGIGFIISVIKRLHKENLGQALMGFGLLFLGLEWLGDTIPQLDQQMIQTFLTKFSGHSGTNLIIGILAGTIITVILDSSSAVTALIITMAHNGLLTWEFSAALVLGSNIGTTTDVLFAQIGANTNAKRAAIVHVLFNVTGSIIVALIFNPFITFVDFLIPGNPNENLPLHISMFHTIFNLSCTLLFLPFVNHIANFTSKLIKSKETETAQKYCMEFKSGGIKENAEAHIIRIEKEIANMTQIVNRMFARIKLGLLNRNIKFIEENFEKFTEEEDYIDQMREEITKYLLCCYDLPLGIIEKNNIHLLLGIAEDIERMSDDCYSFMMLLKKSIEKGMVFENDDINELFPYYEITERSLVFFEKNINKHLSPLQLQEANDIENQIDEYKRNLKKVAAHRLESGANVKTELLYIDLVRNIEKIGDCAFSISKRLAQRIV